MFVELYIRQSTELECVEQAVDPCVYHASGRSTRTKPFSLFLSVELPSLVTVTPRMWLPSYAYCDVKRSTVWLDSLTRSKNLKKNVDESMDTAQEHLKRHFDEKVRALPVFEIRWYVCAYKPPGAVVTSDARNVDTASYHKRVSNTSGRTGSPLQRTTSSVCSRIVS